MIQITFETLKRKVKNFLHLPITRVEVLEYAKELQSTRQYPGLCLLLEDALSAYEIWPFASTVFLKFNIKDARAFGAYEYAYSKKGGYWWERGDWNTGRLKYLNWLIEQYKDDKTNIRKL